MTDLFGDWVKDEWLDRMFAAMALCRHHRFQVLTKRPTRMREYLGSIGTRCRIERLLGELKPGSNWNGNVYEASLTLIGSNKPLPNNWLGVSAEDQATADERILDLLATRAAVRFVSCEPMLGPIDFNALGDGPENLNALSGLRENPFGAIVTRRIGTKLDWVICGGESGHDARPMNPDWARSIRDQCATAGVPFFFKQHGEWGPNRSPPIHKAHRWPLEPNEPYGGVWSYRVGKKRAGRLLDGLMHNEFPEVAQ